jgi:hypothetical protein
METPEIKIPEPRLPKEVVVGRMIEKLEEVKADPAKQKIHWWDRAWAWTSGKKSITGIALMLAGGVLCVGPGTQVAGWKMIGEGAFYLGVSMAGVGLASKMQKQVDPAAGQSVKTDFLSLLIEFLKKILSLLTKAK